MSNKSIKNSTHNRDSFACGHTNTKNGVFPKECHHFVDSPLCTIRNSVLTFSCFPWLCAKIFSFCASKFQFIWHIINSKKWKWNKARRGGISEKSKCFLSISILCTINRKFWNWVLSSRISCPRPVTPENSTCSVSLHSICCSYIYLYSNQFFVLWPIKRGYPEALHRLSLK